MKELSREQTEYAVARLVRLVEAREIKQTQLEQWSSVNQSTISKILSRSDAGHEKYIPSEEVLRKLFQALGLKLSDILNESDRMADEILGYLATPLTGLTATADAEVRRVVHTVKSIAAEQNAPPPFEIYWPGDHTHPTKHSDISSNQVYVTDRSRASTHDFIIMFCGAPSYGVGQENEIATQSGVPAIRLVPTGLSRMMLGSFIHTTDIPYSGTLETKVTFDGDKLRAALVDIRQTYFRHRALYRGMNGDAFGERLRKLIDERSGDHSQFAADLGISLSYLQTLLEEPFAVTNPSARLLKRMALRLGERAWIGKTPGIDAAIALRMKDDWRHDYSLNRREQSTTSSFRKQNQLMRTTDWDKQYQKIQKDGRGAANAKQGTLL